MITLRYLVKHEAVVADDSCENVQPTRRTLGVCLCSQAGWESELFDQRDEIRSILLQDRAALAEVHSIGLVAPKALFDGFVVGQEAATEAIRYCAEPQIQAGGLNVGVRDV